MKKLTKTLENCAMCTYSEIPNYENTAKTYGGWNTVRNRVRACVLARVFLIAILTIFALVTDMNNHVGPDRRIDKYMSF